ncbi:MFS transporter [Streptomyces chromofuscus]|uniref:MFS transporter n=1 Tax=Streptomyces chromofuscus TaxID=42881 RepID=A0A7M2T6Q0_STRCW|nr:MFS transporter [Streptomyces chromofuscus]QOV43829.1 MFS transporter [Streptomyces chromofuscus]GGT21526.1 MFS transporter [Streptomyces chromofuscus]
MPPLVASSRSFQPRTTLLVLLLAVFAFALLQSLINPVLPALQEDLDTTQNLIAWVMTAFLLSASVCTPVVGRLGDRYGKDRVLVASLIALAAGAVVSATAPDISLMLAGRVVQGVGGGVLPLTFGIIRDELPREKTPGAIGVAAALAAVGGGVGVVVAGPLTDAFGIRSLFWIPAALIVVAAVASRVVVPPSPARNPTPVSWLATVLMAGWLVALLVPLAQASRWGWTSPAVIVPFLGAAALATGWVVVEKRSDRPLIDMRMLRSTAVWTTNLVSLLFGVSLFAVMAFLPIFVQTPPQAGYGFGASVTQAGLLLLPMTVTMFLAGLGSARLAGRFGARQVLVTASALNVVAVVALAVEHDRRWQIAAALALMGVSLGIAFSTMSNVIVAAVRPDQTGVANGVTANVRTIGGSVGVAVMSGILGAHTPADGLPSESGYTYGFAVLAVAGVAALLVASLIPVPKPGATTQGPAVPSG